MDKLISRAAAIDSLTNTNLKRNVDSVQDGDMNRTRRAAQRIIASLPTIDAIPVEWLEDKMFNGTRDVSAAAWRVLNEWHPHDVQAWQQEQEAQDG